MKFTQTFLQRPRLVFVLVAFVSVAGFTALRLLVQRQDPNLVQPALTITAHYPGAPPTAMRNNVVMPIENQLAVTPDLMRINSVVQSGTARVSAVFTRSSAISTDLANTMRALQAARKQLPTDMAAPTIQINDPS
jgi:multidrug efflux pump